MQEHDKQRKLQELATERTQGAVPENSKITHQTASSFYIEDGKAVVDANELSISTDVAASRMAVGAGSDAVGAGLDAVGAGRTEASDSSDAVGAGRSGASDSSDAVGAGSDGASAAGSAVAGSDARGVSEAVAGDEAKIREREVELASIALKANTISEALKELDNAKLRAAVGEHSYSSASEYDAFEASFPAGSDDADVAWTFDDNDNDYSPKLNAARVGVEAAAPIVVPSNTQALEAAQVAAIMAAESGAGKAVQEAAAVAAAAAAAGNSSIDVDVSSRDAHLREDASPAEVQKLSEELDKSINKLDLESPRRSLLSLTWPIFIDLALNFATLIINTIMVGMVSVKAVAELTIGNQVFDLALIIFNFFNIGVCVVCAQALGANNKRLARRIIHIGLGVNLIIGTLVSIAIFLSAGLIVKLMQVPEEIADSSLNYLQILSLSFLPLAICLVGSAILRAHNCTRDAMYISLLINVLTVLGNTLFLFGYLGVPVLGVEGVAISTVIGRTIAALVFIPLIIKRTRTHIIPRFMFVFRKKVIYSILNIGLPGAGENLSWHTQYMFMTGVVASMGAMQLATQGIYFQIVQVLMLLTASIGMGTELLVAHYTGAMRLDLANRQLIRSVIIGEVVTFFLTFSMPLGTGALLIGIFTSNEEVLILASSLFLLTVFQEPGRILNIIIINSLRATGDTKFPLIMAVITMWGVAVPLGCYLGLHLEMGLLGVWIGFTADEWIRGLAMVFRWKSGAWKESAKRIYEETLSMEKDRSNLKTAAAS